MAMAGSGMIPAFAISIGRIGNFNHTGRFYSVAANRIAPFYSLPPNKKCLFNFVVSNKICTFATKSKYMEKELFRTIIAESQEYIGRIHLVQRPLYLEEYGSTAYIIVFSLMTWWFGTK